MEAVPSARARCGARVGLSLAALVLAPFSYFWTIDVPFLRATALTSWVLLALALVLALTAAARDRRAWVRGVAGLELAFAALFLWSFFVGARLPEGHVPVRAVDFTLPDQEGRPVTLAAELAKGPVLLVFFRGHW
jgi:cytochrome oxidase Cu insertion factor (SCO1/SenC/PrrC family)